MGKPLSEYVFCNFFVDRMYSVNTVKNKDNFIRFADCDFNLFANMFIELEIGIGNESAGIYQEKLFSRPLGFAIIPVTCYTCKRMYDCDAPADYTVEKR